MAENEAIKGAVSDEAGLKEAIANNQSSIEIEGNLAQKVVRVKATGAVAWVVAVGAVVAIIALVVRSYFALPATSGALMAIPGDSSAQADSSVLIALGILALVAISAILIAVFNRLRKYKVEKLSDSRVRLERK
ncbi:hypothetical protein CQA49_07575 [Helicobacter sp. MIT 00-7814]|uniref:hypothetical protein n=1 Tax=unclassified Helicobacter TaxID=2593540 RepID=UPI000E1E38C0|nr:MULTISPECIES: hypothetical protein [unclassified Helicobacter]RDU52581.1 hypothetical protein CQA37_08270 [Helicobacter sp. MIT 99-10781]RDU52879.1 hypothetical protein CQA49_07575 [Helicobacter sp. MIT 00-7814]